MPSDLYVAVVSPEGAHLLRQRGRGEPDLALAEGSAGSDSNGAVDALARLLRGSEVGSGSLHVLLSSHFVQFQLLPWRDEIGSVAELHAYAQFSFEQVYGSVASSWTPMVSPDAPGRPRLAAAVPSDLLQRLSALPSECGGQKRIVLKSVQPYLTAAFNRYARAACGDDFLFVLAEPSRTSLLSASEGRWQSVRVGAWDGRPESIKAAIEREMHLSSSHVGDSPKVFIHSPIPDVLPVPGVNATILGAKLPGAVVSGKNAGWGMALAGMAQGTT